MAEISLGVLMVFMLVWIILAHVFGRDALAESSGTAAPWTGDATGSNGTDTAPTDDLYQKVLFAFTKLVAAISGFYFAGRTGQTLDKSSDNGADE